MSMIEWLLSLKMSLINSRDVVIVAHQVVIRCFFVYFKMITKEEALTTEIHNCYPYLIKEEMKF